MAYEKARELLDLAIALSASHYGLSASKIEELLAEGAARTQSGAALQRQRQRMLSQLRVLFGPALVESKDGEQHRRWTLRTTDLANLPLVEPADLAALDRACQMLAKRGDADGASRLGRVSAGLRTAIDTRRRRSLETDFEALREAQAVAMQPGPFARIDPKVEAIVSDAILMGRCIAFDYRGHDGMVRHREVEPVGVLLGPRPYLVARLYETAATNCPGHWRMDRIEQPELLDVPARAMPDGFRLDDHARKLFGVYWNETEYEEVEWRFDARAAGSAQAWAFHPDQKLEHHVDGSLTVRFRASGHLEMAWHLYQWGDAVEVVKPLAVANLVKGYRRADFKTLP